MAKNTIVFFVASIIEKNRFFKLFIIPFIDMYFLPKYDVQFVKRVFIFLHKHYYSHGNNLLLTPTMPKTLVVTAYGTKILLQFPFLFFQKKSVVQLHCLGLNNISKRY